MKPDPRGKAGLNGRSAAGRTRKLLQTTRLSAVPWCRGRPCSAMSCSPLWARSSSGVLVAAFRESVLQQPRLLRRSRRSFGNLLRGRGPGSRSIHHRLGVADPTLMKGLESVRFDPSPVNAALVRSSTAASSSLPSAMWGGSRNRLWQDASCDRRHRPLIRAGAARVGSSRSSIRSTASSR
jgi:hypothetical protein